MGVVLQLNEYDSLPENGLLIPNHYTIPHWTELEPAGNRCSLLEPIINKSSHPSIFKSWVLETIDSYHDVQIQVYTDGSALDCTSYPGCGAYLKFPDRSENYMSEA